MINLSRLLLFMLKDIIVSITQNESIIGIGTGNTVKEIIRHLPKGKTYVPASTKTLQLLHDQNLNIQPLEVTNHCDLYIDSADFYDSQSNLLKGGGASLVTEKFLMKMSDRNIIIVQKHKLKYSFIDCTVAIEVLPFALKYFSAVLEKRRLRYRVREGSGKIGPIITDTGGIIFDVEFDRNFINECKSISGVIDHGYVSSEEFNIFIYEL